VTGDRVGVVDKFFVAGLGAAGGGQRLAKRVVGDVIEIVTGEARLWAARGIAGDVERPG
jgi:hypothetical protein